MALTTLTSFAFVSSPALWRLLGLFITFTLVRRVIRAFTGSLSGIPGPFWAKFSRWDRVRKVATGDSHEIDRQLHQEYGPLVRNGPARVSISDPEAIPIIYGMSDQYVKTQFYGSMVPIYHDTLLDSVFTTRDPEKHQQLRKPVAQIFGMTSVRALEWAADECTDIFTKAMHETQGQIIDLGVWVQWYAFDVIGNMTFNKKFGFLEQRKDVEDMIGDIEKGLPFAAILGQIPEMIPLLSITLKSLAVILKPFGKVPFDPLRSIVKFTEDCIEHYTRDGIPDDRPDFLYWLQSKSISHIEVVNHTSNNLLAGSDTTAISLRSVFYFILKNPEAYQMLQKEIDDADREGLSTFVTYGESLKMPYLQAVMKEAMRLSPGVSMPLERFVPPEGVTICDRRLPGGTIVGINPAVVHRDPNVFTEPDKFLPERWIDCTDDKARIMERCLLTFGAGRRVCLGKNISIMEMGKFVPQILRHFDLEWASDQENWTIKTFWFAKQHGLKVKFKARSYLAKGEVE